MKRLISLLLILVCLFSLAACATDPTESTPAGNGGSSNNGSSNGSGNENNGGGNSGSGENNKPEDGIQPGDDVVEDDGSLEMPTPEQGATCTVDAAAWVTLLAEDALRTAMKENSLTMLTTDGNTEQYQMFYCAGGRFGCLQNGNYRSETVCVVEDGTVYIYNKTSPDSQWTRTTTPQSYDEYVASRYFDGAMRYYSNLSGIYAQARFEETEKSYIVENYAVAEGVTGTLKVQFSDGKLCGIKLFLSVDGQTGCISTAFGTVAVPEIPTDYKEENSSSGQGSSQHNPGGDKLPMEAVCSESTWKRLFGQARVLQSLMENHVNVKIEKSGTEYLYQMGMECSRYVFTGSSYEEMLFGHAEYFSRDSKDGQWLRYSDRRGVESLLEEKAAVMTQLLVPLSDRYSQVVFDGSKIFTLTNVSLDHDVFGNVRADYTIMIQGNMVEEMQATIHTSAGDWKLTCKSEKSQKITFPQEYVDMSENGKKPHK